MVRRPVVLSMALMLSASSASAEQKRADDEPAPVAFRMTRIVEADSANARTRTFAGTYGAGDAQTKFLVDFDVQKVRGVDEKGDDLGVNIMFSTGRFRHVASSNPRPFLDKIAVALKAKSPRLSTTHATALPFDIAMLGDHETRSRAGGFSNTPPGKWVAAKLFLANGAAEVYYNFNPVTGDAEISIKDEAYGNTVVEELSKILW